jgi:hypothetical protein
MRIRCVLALTTMLAAPATARNPSLWTDDPGELRDRIAAVFERDSTVPSESTDLSRRTHLILESDRAWRVIDKMIRIGDSFDEMAVQTIKVDPDLQVEVAQAWWMRPDGTAVTALRLLEESSVRIEQTDDSATIVFGFPALSPGDFIGWSARFRSDATVLQLELPVQESRAANHVDVVIEVAEDVLYEVIPRRAPLSGATMAIAPRDDDGGVRYAFGFSNVAALSGGLFAAPAQLAGPVIDIAILATGLGPITRRQTSHWAAIALWLQHYEDNIAEKNLTLQDRARRIAAGRPRLSMFERDIVEFVRDEIKTIPSSGTSMRVGTNLVSCFDDRMASQFEKALMLMVMFRAYTDDVSLVQVRSPDRGDCDFSLPSWTLFDGVVVRVSDGDGARLYDPGCDLCRAGEIRSSFRGGRAFVHHLSVAEAIRLDLNNRRLPIPDTDAEFFDSQNWFSWTELPGERAAPSARIHETFQWDPRTAGFRVAIESTGESAIRSDFRRRSDARAVAMTYIEATRPGAQVGVWTSRAHATADTLRMHGSITSPPLPNATEKVWFIPAGFVFGRAVVPEIRQRQTYFHEAGLERTTLLRIPLPPDWTSAAPPDGWSIERGGLRYELRFAIDEGDLVCERVFQLPAGICRPRYGIDALHEALDRIHQIEARPLVVERDQ